MNATRQLLVATAIVLVSACAAPRKPPPPVVAPPIVRPTPTPAPPPPPADWRDAPITPGDWTYGAAASGSVANFGGGSLSPLLALQCDRAANRIVLRRAGSAAGPVPLTITTTNATRSFSAAPSAPPQPPELVVALAPRDPILDAIVFSRGRFMVEAAGLPTLFLPTWPEVARVVEDCR